MDGSFLGGLLDEFKKDQDKVPEPPATAPLWISSIKPSENAIIEIKNLNTLFPTILNICTHIQDKYIIVFRDLDIMLKFVISYINIVTSEGVHIIGYDYLKFAFPYLSYPTNSPTVEKYIGDKKRNVAVITTYDKLKSVKLDNSFTYIYDKYVETTKSKQVTFCITLDRFHLNSIKTFNSAKCIRSYRCIVVYPYDRISAILDIIIKYNHRQTIIYGMPDEFLNKFPVKMSDYKKLEYDSDFEDDHVKNQTSNTINVCDNSNYDSILKSNEIYIYTNGEEIPVVNKNRQLLVFWNGYTRGTLQNILMSSNKDAALDIVIFNTAPTDLFSDMGMCKPLKLLHFTGNGEDTTHLIEDCLSKMKEKL